jgi:hypothetical protein
MRRRTPGLAPLVIREVVTALPGRRRLTSQPEPERDRPETSVVISTGSDDVAALSSVGHRLIGLVFWVGWFSWGIYTWWFVDRAITDFVIGVVVWTGAFVFSVVGIPLVRQAARGQQQQ